MKTKRKYWYFIEFWECPVCGRSSQYRERRYTKKPKSIKKRYNYVRDSMCGCIY